MAEYNGSLSVMSGIAPEGAIPVVNAKDVWVESTGDGPSNFKSLADVLDEALGSGTGGSDYDDTEIKEDIEGLSERVDSVEQQISAITQLPPVTTTDNGKFLRVVGGTWAVASIPYADEEGY